MDVAIEAVVVQEREAARMHLQWTLDAWRLELGMVEVIPNDTDAPIHRTLRHKRGIDGRAIATPVTAPEPPARFLPTAPGWGVLIRDVPTLHERAYGPVADA